MKEKDGFAAIDSGHAAKHFFELLDADNDELFTQLVAIKMMMKHRGIARIYEIDTDTADTADIYLKELEDYVELEIEKFKQKFGKSDK